MSVNSATKVILVRHGETAWNAGEVYRGRADVPLNKTGLRQVEKLGAALRDERIAAVFSSPLSRSMQTAEAVAAHHDTKVVEAPELIDICYGKWEGLQAAEVEKKYPALTSMWLDSPDTVKFPGGESLSEVRRRAAGFLRRAADEHEGETIVLASHRAVLKTLILFCLKLGNERFWNVRIDNAACSAFEWRDNDFILTSHNQCAHLKGIRKTGLKDF